MRSHMESTALVKAISCVFIPLITELALEVSCISSHACEQVGGRQKHEGKVFPGKDLTLTTDIDRIATPSIFGCRHLCKYNETCKGLAFDNSTQMSPRPMFKNCVLHYGRDLGKFLAPKNNSIVILKLPSHCGETSVTGSWSAWQPCAYPCGQLHPVETRNCTNPAPTCNGPICPGNHTRQMDTPICNNAIDDLTASTSTSTSTSTTSTSTWTFTWTSTSTSTSTATSTPCSDISSASVGPAGVRYFRIGSLGRRVPLFVEMIDGIAWITIQRRFGGSEEFRRSWQEFKNGFGDVTKEFWLGNENIYNIASSLLTLPYKLRIDIYNGAEHRFAEYDNLLFFGNPSYALSVVRRDGNLTSGPLSTDGISFSTYDNSPENLAEQYGGGWWAYQNEETHLVDIPLTEMPGQNNNGIEWKIEMKIRQE